MKLVPLPTVNLLNRRVSWETRIELDVYNPSCYDPTTKNVRLYGQIRSVYFKNNELFFLVEEEDKHTFHSLSVLECKATDKPESLHRNW